MDKIFKLKEHHTDVKTEILAGLTTFMTMAYVLAVQPGAIVGAEAAITDCNGDVISKSAILVMCALISGLVTILMAFYANMPFALSTGMGTNFLLGTISFVSNSVTNILQLALSLTTPSSSATDLKRSTGCCRCVRPSSSR